MFRKFGNYIKIMLMFGKALLYAIYWTLIIAIHATAVLLILDWLGVIAVSSQVFFGILAFSIPLGLIGGFTGAGRKIARRLMNFFGELSSITSGS